MQMHDKFNCFEITMSTNDHYTYKKDFKQTTVRVVYKCFGN